MATKSDKDEIEVAKAEHLVDTRLPTKCLNLTEARIWLESIAHAEDIDPPAIIQARLPKRLHGLASPDHHAIVVSNSKPTQLTLLHELAHFMGSTGHGPQFREALTGLLRRHLSLQHSLVFAEGINSNIA